MRFSLQRHGERSVCLLNSSFVATWFWRQCVTLQKEGELTV